MMTNLFSIFDPSASILSMNWSMWFMATLVIPLKLWASSSPLSKLLSMVMNIFKKEIKFSLLKMENSTMPMIMSIFLIILTMNFLALYPQVFSVTSHMTTTLPMSLLLWLSIVSFGVLNNTNHILTHLLPQGTPNALMSFMVMIELISNMIRPITLCVRLTANLIAGHLLMSLLGNAILNMKGTLILLSTMVPTLLTILESGVACIQAYVFMTLITLYISEIK